MKIGIYNEPASAGIGGSEYFMAVLAEALSCRHEVDFVHHRPTLTTEQLTNISAADLSTVRLRYVPRETPPLSGSHNPLRRYRQAQRWHAALSEPYDIFINSAHNMPPFCHAPRGVLIILFPTLVHANIRLWHGEVWADDSFAMRNFRRLYNRWEWRKRFESYQLKMSISAYTQLWTRRWWGIDSRVVYPPVNAPFRVTDKKANYILSVGRYTTVWGSKKQLEMVAAFRRIREAGLHDWQYFCAGGLGDSCEDQTYFENVRQAGRGNGDDAAAAATHVLANLERAELTQLFEQAKIFWHAVGYGEDDGAHPEHVEHFGIVTVEAMAAGCVPVVINKGGQREIVQHGVNGFLWNTLEELKEYTLLLAHNEELRAQMAAAARERARFFSRDEYVKQFLDLLQPLLT